MKKKILLVFGTRPEAIKMAPVHAAFMKRRGEFATRVCVTAQHREMLDEVLQLFRIKPSYDLDIMRAAQSLSHITTAALDGMGSVLAKEKPHLVLVHGDTTTTFAATLAAFYHRIPVGHVEAGLRSGDRTQPFPEEANRLLTDALCDLYFAPTSTARRALRAENIPDKRIFVTGNTVIDALRSTLAQRRGFSDPALKKLFGGLSRAGGRRVVLVTAHRRENFGKPLTEIFRALRRAAVYYPEAQFVYPVHLNPQVQEPARRILGGLPNFFLIPPIGYADLTAVMERAYLIVTDSGGLQEEAPSLGKPVLVLRSVTERPEAVEAGTVRIVGTREQRVYAHIRELMDNPRVYRAMARSVNPYGDGKAAERIVEAVRSYFGLRRDRPAPFGPR